MSVFLIRLHNLMQVKLWVIRHHLYIILLHLCLLTLPVVHTNTCCLKYKCRSLFAAQMSLYQIVRRVHLCMFGRQREPFRNWNSVAPPLPCPTGHAGVWVAMPVFIHLSNQGRWGARVLQQRVYQQIRGSESPLVWLSYNNVFFSEPSQDNKET